MGEKGTGAAEAFRADAANRERLMFSRIQGPRLHVLDDTSRSFCPFCHAAKEPYLY